MAKSKVGQVNSTKELSDLDVLETITEVESTGHHLREDNLTVEQLAARLQRPVGTIYYWVSRNEIPYERQGKRLAFNYREVKEHFRRKTEEQGKRCSFEALPLKEGISSLKIRSADHAALKKME